jgi:hypothetical protein
MAFQLIIIHIGIKRILKEIKKIDIPSTVINISPQLIEEFLDNHKYDEKI